MNRELKIGDTVYETNGVRIYPYKILDVCVLRKHEQGYFYYSVELTDGKTNNSIVICRLNDIEKLADIEH